MSNNKYFLGGVEVGQDVVNAICDGQHPRGLFCAPNTTQEPLAELDGYEAVNADNPRITESLKNIGFALEDTLVSWHKGSTCIFGCRPWTDDDWARQQHRSMEARGDYKVTITVTALRDMWE